MRYKTELNYTSGGILYALPPDQGRAQIGPKEKCRVFTELCAPDFAKRCAMPYIADSIAQMEF